MRLRADGRARSRKETRRTNTKRRKPPRPDIRRYLKLNFSPPIALLGIALQSMRVLQPDRFSVSANQLISEDRKVTVRVKIALGWKKLHTVPLAWKCCVMKNVKVSCLAGRKAIRYLAGMIH